MPGSALEQWLKYAPAPKPLEPQMKFHVFLSYRSVNRGWVLQLYDILRGLNYEVFLDQYNLAASSALALSLGEALEASQAAIMMWSSAFEDSEWCKKEFNTLEAKENSGTGFRYVIAKLDESPLPGFASGKIHVDFSQDRDGPGGSGLLRLLYGMNGEPLPPDAVRLAADVDAEVKTARAQIKAARTNGFMNRLEALAQSNGLAWLTSPALKCEVAEAMIGLGNAGAALTLLRALQLQFPRAVRPKQLEGLALARNKDWEGAQTVLGELHANGELDPETVGIYARTWMDRYKMSQDPVHLRKSRDLYQQAFTAAPKDYYTGINAAAKSLFLGDRDLATSLAKKVEGIVGLKPVAQDYWKSATVAEVQLLQAAYDNAAALYAQAVSIEPEAHGNHQSTKVQAASILKALNAPPETHTKVLSAFDHQGCRA
jgi:tetratricopeptide (TPR) repeat protein